MGSTHSISPEPATHVDDDLVHPNSRRSHAAVLAKTASGRRITLRSQDAKRSSIRNLKLVVNHSTSKLDSSPSPIEVAAVIDKLPRAVVRRLQPKFRKLGFDITFRRGKHTKVVYTKEQPHVLGDDALLHDMLVKEEGMRPEVADALIKEMREHATRINQEINALDKRLDDQHSAKAIRLQRARAKGEVEIAQEKAAKQAGLFTEGVPGARAVERNNSQRGLREVIHSRRARLSLRANNTVAAEEEDSTSTLHELFQQTSYRPERDGKFVKKTNRKAQLRSANSGSFKKRGRKVLFS